LINASRILACVVKEKVYVVFHGSVIKILKRNSEKWAKVCASKPSCVYERCINIWTAFGFVYSDNDTCLLRPFEVKLGKGYIFSLLLADSEKSCHTFWIVKYCIQNCFI